MIIYIAIVIRVDELLSDRQIDPILSYCAVKMNFANEYMV